MPPDVQERLQTAVLYGLFVVVYVAVAGLLGSLVGLVVGIARQSEGDILTGFLIGAGCGLLLGVAVAWLGRHGAPPSAVVEDGEGTSDAAGDSPALPVDGSRPTADE